jgi:hypothetical protein
MMVRELAIIGVVVGILLGLRYKILILVPALMLAMILAIIVGVASADSFWSIVLATIAVVIAVQLGYLAGIMIRAVIAAFRSPRKEGGDSNSEIAFAWQHIWRWDDWVWSGPIARLHPLLPPQA